MQTLATTTQSLAAVGVLLVRLSIWLALLSAVFVPLERLFALRPQALFRKGIATDLGYYFISGLVPACCWGRRWHCLPGSRTQCCPTA